VQNLLLTPGFWFLPSILRPMKLIFPENFIFGTSTAAYQIETAFEHDWCDVRARDGHLFNRTTDHEKRYEEDVSIIAEMVCQTRRMGETRKHSTMDRLR
jgi:hypothetical protein